MQAHAIQGPWAAGERILVCVSEDPARARASCAMPSGWPTGCMGRGWRSMSKAAAALQLSRTSATASPTRCGSPKRSAAKPSRFPAGDRNIADDVIGYAQANNVTQIIIGKSTRSRWFEILHGSVVHDLVRRSGNISVHVIAGDQLSGESDSKESVRTRRSRRQLRATSLRCRLCWRVAIALGCA